MEKDGQTNIQLHQGSSLQMVCNSSNEEYTKGQQKVVHNNFIIWFKVELKVKISTIFWEDYSQFEKIYLLISIYFHFCIVHTTARLYFRIEILSTLIAQNKLGDGHKKETHFDMLHT